MKKFRKVLSSLLAASMLMATAACGSSAPASSSTSTPAASPSPASSNAPASTSESGPKPEDYEWPKFITILGASSGGNAILSLNAISQVLTEVLPTTVSAQVTPGASQNMYLLEQGDGTYAWGSDFYIYSANEGILNYADDPVELEMNTIMHYSNSVVQIAVRKGSGITSVEELRGKKVVVGEAGGGTESFVHNMMEVLGLYVNGDYDFQAEYSGVAAGCELISNAQADAIIIGGTIPFSSYMELFVTDKIELIGLSDEEVNKIEEAKIGRTRVTIPAGSYDGKVPSELLTVASKSGLVCRTDCPEEEVYWITRTICEHWEELGVYMETFKGMTAQEAALNTVSNLVDIHPGALRYYQEMGWM